MDLHRLAIAAIVLLTLSSAGPAAAANHGGGHGGSMGHPGGMGHPMGHPNGHFNHFHGHGGVFFRGSFFVGPGFYGYPYAGYYPYYPPYYPYYPGYYSPAPQVWYFCDAYQQYYPNVTQCPSGWRMVQ